MSAATGFRVVRIGATGSTNDDAMDAGRRGEPEGLVIVAESQTAGRGRMGRSWYSPATDNLYLSILVRPSVAPGLLPRLTLLAGVAAARTVEAHGAAAELKWPNDVMVAKRKLAGILCEADEGFAVVGAGFNLNSVSFPEGLRLTATSLRLCTGSEVDRTAFAGSFLGEFRRLYEPFRETGDWPRAEWLRFWRLKGAAVVVRDGGESVRGTAIGPAEDGAFVLRADGGAERRFLGGELEVA